MESKLDQLLELLTEERNTAKATLQAQEVRLQSIEASLKQLAEQITADRTKETHNVGGDPNDNNAKGAPAPPHRSGSMVIKKRKSIALGDLKGGFMSGNFGGVAAAASLNGGQDEFDEDVASFGDFTSMTGGYGRGGGRGGMSVGGNPAMGFDGDESVPLLAMRSPTLRRRVAPKGSSDDDVTVLLEEDSMAAGQTSTKRATLTRSAAGGDDGTDGGGIVKSYLPPPDLLQPRRRSSAEDDGQRRSSGGGIWRPKSSAAHDDTPSALANGMMPAGVDPTAGGGVDFDATAAALVEEVNESFLNSLNRIRAGAMVNVECYLVTAMDIVFLLMSVVVSTVTIALWHPGEEESQTSDPPSWLLGTVATAEIFTAFWIFVRFHVRSRHGEWEIVERKADVKKLYLKTWFLMDLIYTLPLDLVMLPISHTAFYVMLFRHLLRYFRGLSIGGSVNPLLSGRRKGFNFVSYCCTLMIAAHIIACVFWAMADENCPDYVSALYWATATLTGTGYGDIVANGETQRTYAIICMVAGIITVSTFTAFATKFLASKNSIVAEKEKQKETMHSMMKYYQVPWETQVQVMRCFASVLNRHNERQFKRMTEDLPQVLRDDLFVYFNAHQLRMAPLFSKVHDQHLLVELAARMKRAFIAPFEYIFHQGDVCQGPWSPDPSQAVSREDNDAASGGGGGGSSATSDGMYFIISGVVEIVVECEEEDVVVATLRQQDCFGEGALLYENHRRSASAQAKAPSEFIVLTTHDFRDVLQFYHDPHLIEAMRTQHVKRQQRIRKVLVSVQEGSESALGVGEKNVVSGGPSPARSAALSPASGSTPFTEEKSFAFLTPSHDQHARASMASTRLSSAAVSPSAKR